MKLSVRGITLACAIIWGLVMLLVSVANMVCPSYGVDFLFMMSSIYPGYEFGQGMKGVIVGTLYGIVDGGIGGVIFAWLYNLFAE